MYLGGKFEENPVTIQKVTSENMYKGATGNIPDSFDWRQKEPDCVGEVRSQLTCGSCWAFAATSALADRACVKYGSKYKGVVLSPQDSVLCDTANFGCQGGYPDKAWEFFSNPGVVNAACMPYAAKG